MHEDTGLAESHEDSGAAHDAEPGATTHNGDSQNKRASDRRLVGLLLIAIALVFGAAQIFDLEVLQRSVVFLLGVVFYGWGIARREPGGLIPGGILLGLGVGIILESSEAVGTIPGVGAGAGGLFMMSFALGWVAITVGTALFTDETQWWPLIPGAIMALIGVAAFGFPLGMQLLELAGRAWWVIPLAIGIWLVFRSGSGADD